jgi:hypothetical protein
MSRRRATARALPHLLVAMAAWGCGDSTTETPEEPPRYAELQADVFEPSCTFACHSGGEFAAGGLDMESPPDVALVEVIATAVPCTGAGWMRVVRGRPDESLLYLKVAAKHDGVEAPCGDVMPSGAERPALSTEQLARVRSWIEAGAPED